MSDVEARLGRLEDRAAIDDLVARYFLAADGDDLAGVGASFTRMERRPAMTSARPARSPALSSQPARNRPQAGRGEWFRAPKSDGAVAML